MAPSPGGSDKAGSVRTVGGRLAFALVDVFATRPLSGNPLAVVADADELDVATMRRIAVEFNLSETTFVLRPTVSDAAWWLRSFTPSGQEVVGAGHNALGAWWWLAVNGRVDVGGPAQRQQLGDRSLPVRVVGDQAPARVVMAQGPADIGPTVDIRSALATALGVSRNRLAAEFGPRVVSTGVAHLMVPLPDRAALQELAPDPEALRDVLRSVGAQGCYAFTQEVVDPAAHAHARFFNPTVGIREDPATGSAAGPLAALLLDHRVVSPSSTVVVEQGFEMGRPSRLEVFADETGVELAGSCVIVADGVLHL